MGSIWFMALLITTKIITIPVYIITSPALQKTAGMVMMGMVMMKHVLQSEYVKFYTLFIHCMIFLDLIHHSET